MVFLSAYPKSMEDLRYYHTYISKHVQLEDVSTHLIDRKIVKKNDIDKIKLNFGDDMSRMSELLSVLNRKDPKKAPKGFIQILESQSDYAWLAELILFGDKIADCETVISYPGMYHFIHLIYIYRHVFFVKIHNGSS